jgi:hypothetical protein
MDQISKPGARIYGIVLSFIGLLPSWFFGPSLLHAGLDPIPLPSFPFTKVMARGWKVPPPLTAKENVSPTGLRKYEDDFGCGNLGCLFI